MNDLGFTFEAMASRCEIRIAGLSQTRAQKLADSAMKEVRRIETTYSRYRDDSVISRINAAAGSNQPIEVDDETASLLNFSAQLYTLSDGLFDITSGVLRRAWDFRKASLPDSQAIAALLPSIGWQHVTWDGRSIYLTRPNMQLDFGGIGKEYAADRAATLLQEQGVKHGLVNLGGDIRVLGPKPNGSPWMLGVQHPREEDSVVASLPLKSGALATSGDYERYFELDGKRYCHILDPRSGWPVHHWQSISVVAPICIAAGALSTIAMLKGEAAPEFLKAQGVAFLCVDRHGEVIRHSLEVPT